MRGRELALCRGARERRPCRPPGWEADEVDSRGRFQIATERLGADSVVLRLAGEIDVAAIPALDGALRRVERGLPASVLVEAEDVGFIDLLAIARLASAHRRLERVGGGLLIVRPPDCLLRVIDLLTEVELPVLR